MKLKKAKKLTISYKVKVKHFEDFLRLCSYDKTDVSKNWKKSSCKRWWFKCFLIIFKKIYYICKKNKMDKKELNKELINCLVKRSNLQREIRELYEDIEVLNAELYKKISRVVEARVELENLAERYIEIKLKQQNFLE